MAVNEVQLTISVGDNGSLGVVAKKADAAAKATGRLTKQTGQLGRTSTTTYREMQGTAGTSSNLTKNFAKQAQGIQGGLVPAYATLAANVFAITAAFGALQRAAQVEQLAAGFTFLGNTAGRTATLVAENLTKITEGALSMEQALRAASAGFSAGFSTTELERLTQVAKNAAQALGRDVGDATDRLVRGVAKLEPEILDELGIFVRLDSAVEEYAATLGKSATALTEAERRQAFLNKALEQGERKFGQLTGEVDVNPFDKLAASFNNLAKSLFKLVNEGLGPIINFFAENTVALTGALILFGSTVVKQMLPALDQLGERASASADRVAASAILMRDDALANIRVQELSLKKFKTKLPKKNIYNQIRKDIVAGTATNAQLDAGIKAVTRSVAGKSGAIARTSTKNVARIQAEIAALKEELAVLLSIQAARTGGGELFAKADIAETVAISKLYLADSAASITASKNTREAFTLARKGFKEYKKDINAAFSQEKKLSSGIFGKTLTTIKFGFDKAAAAARLFGTAIIGAIPFVGKLVLGVGVLVGALTAYFGRSKEIIAAQKELNAVLETAAEKVKQYDKEVARLEELATANDRLAIQGEIYANTLRLQAGFTTELAAGFEKLTNALVDEELKNPSFFVAIAAFIREGFLTLFEAAMERISGILEGMVIFAKLTGKFLFDILNAFGGLDVITNAAQSVSEAINETTNEMRRNRVISKIYNEALDEGGVMAERLAEKFGGKDGLTKHINALMSGPGGMHTFAQAVAIVRGELTDLAETLTVDSQNIDNLGQSFSELTRSLTKFREAEKGKDKFLTLATEIDARIELLKSIRKSVGEDEQAFRNQVELRIQDGTMDLSAFGISAEEVRKDAIGATTAFRDEFIAISDGMRLIKNRQKALKIEVAFEKAEKAAAEANREMKNILHTMKLFDRTEFAGLDFLNSIEQKHKDINSQLEKETENKALSLAIQFDLETRINRMNQNLNTNNAEQVRILKAEQKERERLFLLANQTLGIETKLAKVRNDINFIKAQEQQNNALLGAITGAQSAADAIGVLTAALSTLDKDETLKDLFKIEDAEGNIISTGLDQRIKAIKGVLGPTIEEMKKLGPEGEVVAIMIEGIFKITDAILLMRDSAVQATMAMSQAIQQAAKDEPEGFAKMLNIAQTTELIARATAVVASGIAALMNTMAAATRNRIAGIDQEIEAEKKRDGKSAESVSRLQQLEKKKDALKRKEFEQKKKAMMAEVVMATAMAIASAAPLLLPPFTGFGIALIAMIASLGAAQLAIISGMTYQGGGASVGGGGTPSKISAGERGSTVDLATSQSSRGEIGFMRGERGMGQAENFRPTGAFTGYRNRAEGGNTGFIVGEQGPELFVPQVPGTIVPNDDMAAGGGTANVTFNINAVDAAGVEDVLLQQRGNLIGMIREASNSYGQTFLEDVDTSVYSPQGAGVSRY